MRMIRKAAALMERCLTSPFRIAANMVAQGNYPGFSRKSEWAIGIYRGSTPLEVRDAGDIRNPILTAHQVTDVRAEFVADPFMIKENDRWHMFFEVYNAVRQKGEIGLATSRDLYHWSYEKIVLREPFHLSYPLVFKWRERHYMLPESAEANRITLYRAKNFPYDWEPDGDLIEGSFGDHALFYYQEAWWLLAGAEPVKHNKLRLFYAADLKGPWQEHPKSPIVEDDAKIARPGGRPLIFGNDVIRFAQDSSPTYGRILNAFIITKLSKTEYVERPYEGNPVLCPGKFAWNMHGMHHLDAHEIKPGQWVACVDGYKREFKLKLEY